jgi:hypothetical protein
MLKFQKITKALKKFIAHGMGFKSKRFIFTILGGRSCEFSYALPLNQEHGIPDTLLLRRGS